MNLNFNDDRLSIICIYQDIRAPLNFAIRGVPKQVCEQIYKEVMQYDMIYSQTYKRMYDQDQIKETWHHMAIQKQQSPSQVETSIKANKIDR